MQVCPLLPCIIHLASFSRRFRDHKKIPCIHSHNQNTTFILWNATKGFIRPTFRTYNRSYRLDMYHPPNSHPVLLWCWPPVRRISDMESKGGTKVASDPIEAKCCGIPKFVKDQQRLVCANNWLHCIQQSSAPNKISFHGWLPSACHPSTVIH